MNNTINKIKCQPLPFDAPQPQDIALLRALYNSPDFKPFFDPLPADNPTAGIPAWSSYSDATVPKCPLRIPVSLQDDSPMLNPLNSPRQHPAQRYPQLAAEMHAGSINTSTLDAAAAKHLARRPVIAYSPPGDGTSIFLGTVRGDPTYAAAMHRRIEDAASNLLAVPGTALFITITYAVGQETPDIFDAEVRHKHVVDRFLRRARKFGPVSYVSVLEQTHNGYPHAHIILKWRDKYFDSVGGPRGEKFLKDKAMFKLMKGWQPYPQFKVLVVTDKAVKNYISKYVSKGMVPPNKSEVDANPESLKEIRKSRLCYMLGYMCHKRQFRISLDLRNPPQTTKITEVSVDKQTLDDLATMPLMAERGAHILMNLLINLTGCCRSHTQMVLSDKVKPTLTADIGYHQHLDFRLQETFRLSGYYVGCPGCIVTQILDHYREDSVISQDSPD